MNKNQSTGIIVIVAIILIALLSIAFEGPQTSTSEISYTQFLNKVQMQTIESVETLGEFHFLYEKYNKSTGNQQDEIIEIKEEKDCIEEKCATYEDYAKFINFLTNVNR